MLPDRYSYYVEGSKVVFLDKENNGTLTLMFKPLNVKEGSDLLYGTLNDIVTGIEREELDLTLMGRSIIVVQKDVILKGSVQLKSCSLFDPEIVDSRLNLVAVKGRTVINKSDISHFGDTRFGLLKFQECSITKESGFKLPPGRFVNINKNVVIH